MRGKNIYIVTWSNGRSFGVSAAFENEERAKKFAKDLHATDYERHAWVTHASLVEEPIKNEKGNDK